MLIVLRFPSGQEGRRESAQESRECSNLDCQHINGCRQDQGWWNGAVL